MQFLNGKKTLSRCARDGGARLRAGHGYPIPEWIYGVLGALGLGTPAPASRTRSGTSNAARTTPLASTIWLRARRILSELLIRHSSDL